MTYLYWFNQRTGKGDYRDTPDPEEMRAYLPQDPTAQNLYQLYRDMGDDYLKAAEKVLRLAAGSEKEEG